MVRRERKRPSDTLRTLPDGRLQIGYTPRGQRVDTAPLPNG